MKIYICVLFENLSGKFKFHKNRTRITATVHDDRCTLFILCRSFIRKMRNASDNSCREYQNTHFVFSNIFFLKLCRLCDNVGKYDTARQATDDNMAHAHCMLNN